MTFYVYRPIFILSDEQDDVSPKFVKGSRKYGRRSRPVGASSGEGATDYSDTDVSAASPRPARKERMKGGDEGPVSREMFVFVDLF